MSYYLILSIILSSFVISTFGTYLKNLTNRIYIGSQLSYDHLSTDPEYKRLAIDEFNSVTQVVMWNRIEHTRGQRNYISLDEQMLFAEQHHMYVRGSTLSWYYDVPDWVQALEDDNRTAELRHVMDTHITQTVKRFKGRIQAWDVLNEFMDDKGLFRDTIWYRTYGDNLPAHALRLAHSADPSAKLYLNDYHILSTGNKSDAMFALISQLKAQGVPIHGVGVQAHDILFRQHKDIADNMRRYSDIGIDVAVTELDISLKLPSDHQMLERQAEDYVSYFSACLSVPRCVGVTVWGFADKYSWVGKGHFRPGFGEACLWDMELKPKPALIAVRKTLKEHFLGKNITNNIYD